MNNLSDMDQIKGTACIITGDLFNTVNAKTAHGLVRESNRFEILGVLDRTNAGQDAGTFVDGQARDIPIVSSIDELISIKGQTPEYAIIGMATKGGVLPESLYPTIEEALSLGIHIVNGLHEPLSENETFTKVAEENGSCIYDIRKPRQFKDLHFWNGDAINIPALKIAVLGVDCAIGKRTTAKLLANALNATGIRTEMIYTGQTGWLQGGGYGFIFDATPNDFIPGELEHAVVNCYEETKPDVILMEGQASLRNPSGPCGSEFIISAAADAVILQHHPIRTHFLKLDNYPKQIPDAKDEIDLIARLGAPTWAVTLNTAGMSEDEIIEHKVRIASTVNMPVICPLEDGLDELVSLIKTKIKTTA